MKRIAAASLAVALASLGAPPKVQPTGKSANDNIEINATACLDKSAVKELLGSELDGICVVELKVSPKGEQPVRIHPDDFLLRSYKDGQKSQPFAPSQMAGGAALVVSSGGGGGTFVGRGSDGPIWGGTPGTGTRPERIGGDDTGIGNTAGAEVRASLDPGARNGKENPLLKRLKEKMLPAGETAGPLSGLLYFPLEGKHKPKDLRLEYDGAAGKLGVQFK